MLHAAISGRDMTIVLKLYRNLVREEENDGQMLSRHNLGGLCIFYRC
jgi:hypothetical protein